MKRRILLTSFDIWLPDQKSNSANDLLIALEKIRPTDDYLTFVKQIPVDVSLASNRVIKKIRQIQPGAIICCGMAEKRTQLSVESNASSTAISSAENYQRVLYTTVDLELLVKGIENVQISHDCGKFVCEGLYYSVLDYLQQNQIKIPCIFVHVPILTEENTSSILNHFLLIIDRLALS